MGDVSHKNVCVWMACNKALWCKTDSILTLGISAQGYIHFQFHISRPTLRLDCSEFTETSTASTRSLPSHPLMLCSCSVSVISSWVEVCPGTPSALAENSTSLPDCNLNTASFLDRVLVNQHCHLRIENYDDRKVMTVFTQEKKEPANPMQSTELFAVTKYCSCSWIAKTMQKSKECFLATVTWKLVPNSFLSLKTEGHTGLCHLKDDALDFIVLQNGYGWNTHEAAVPELAF